MTGRRGTALLVAALTVALLAGAALAGSLLFDAEALKAMVRDRVHAATGRELRMESLSLRLFPVPALRATGVALSNPGWAQDREMVAADQVDLRLSWRALLSGRVAPGALLIRHGQIHLETAGDGKRNWDMRNEASQSQRANWRDLNDLRVDTVDIVYRSPAGQRQWQVTSMTGSARPGWRDVQLEAEVLQAGRRMRLEADMADLSRAGQAGASSAGRIAAQWQSASATLSGMLPLSLDGSEDAAADLVVQARSAADLIGFFSVMEAPDAPTAGLSLQARLRGARQALTVDLAQLKLGQTEASGALTLRRKEGKLQLEGHLDLPSLDWPALTRDTGRSPPLAIPDNELFRRDPLPWKAMDALAGVDSMLTLRVGTLRLRSGIRMDQVQAQLRGSGNRLSIAPFSMSLLGGTASGKLELDGRRHYADLTLNGYGILLERWFGERGRKLPVAGGPMRISAVLRGRGATQRELAASVDGVITVRGGETVIRSEKAGNAESLLTDLFPLFSERDASQLRLQCFAARLPLHQGRAGQAYAGARSDASQLLTQGMVDLRQQRLDLRGRVRARNGISLGVALVTGDVVIAGPLRRPQMALDPSSPGALARLGAAVLTGGLSVVATAAWDAANPSANPCDAALREGQTGAR